MFNNNNISGQKRRNTGKADTQELWNTSSAEGKKQGQVREQGVGLCIIGMIAVPTRSDGNFNVNTYDCSDSTSIKVYDAETRCQSDPVLPGEKQIVKILQLIVSEQLAGHKCKIRSHKNIYYCWKWSYTKSICKRSVKRHFLTLCKYAHRWLTYIHLLPPRKGSLKL